MTKKDIRKKIFHFLRNEVDSKNAKWGELRRTKGIIDVKKGLPNVPSLILQVRPLISYLVIIVWIKEIRIYLFDKEGSMLGAESYYENTDQIYDFICSKSKKITSYPSKDKEKSIGQLNSEYDRIFQKYWNKLAMILEVPSAIRKKRPIVSIGEARQKEFLDSYQERGFIYIKHPASELKTLYTYYSLFFFIPETFRKDKEISRELAIFLLSKVDKTSLRRRVPELDEIIKKFTLFKTKTAKIILKYLYRIAEYYTKDWKQSDFVILLSIPVPDSLQNIDIAEVFCKIYARGSEDQLFLTLSKLLGISSDTPCELSEGVSDDSLLDLANDVIQWRLSGAMKFLNSEGNRQSKGVTKALAEAIQYKFSTALEIEMSEKNSLLFVLKNKTDLPIIIDQMVQLYENGTEKLVKNEPIVIEPSMSYNIDLNDVDVLADLPLRLSYHIMGGKKRFSKPVFSGTIVL